MTAPLSPQEIEELTAGYVLGDLNSAEAEVFQTLLADMPKLQAEVASLQEALAMMPYGLDDVAPMGGLRSQILTAAKTELSQLEPQVPKRSKRPWVISALAVAGLATVGGLVTLHLTRQGRLLQAQFPQAEQPVTFEQTAIGQTWSGLSQLLQDHRRSLENPDGPVDFVVQQPSEIPALLQGFKTTVAALPLLPRGMLLGGSNCRLGETPGLRLTYQLETEQTVSAYQLSLTDEEFPEFQSAQLTLQQPDGTGIVLWRDDDYLYALVAELPTAELQRLAYEIEGI